MTSREQAIKLHKSGKISDAAVIYRELIEAEPGNVELLSLLAGADLQLGDVNASVANWRRSLAIDVPVPERLRAIANFLTAVRERGPAERAALLADLAIPAWPDALPPTNTDRLVIAALADCLVRLDLRKAAVSLLESVLPHVTDDGKFLATAVYVMLEAGETDKALRLLRPLPADGGRIDETLLIAHAAVANAAGRIEESDRLTRQVAEAVPVYLTPKEPRQLVLVGVLNPVPSIQRPLDPFHLHFASNTPATLALRLSDKYRFLSIFPEAKSAARALAKLPRPSVVLNNWVNGERLSGPGLLKLVADFADGLGLPVLNHPRGAAQTTRQHNAQRLAGIPHVVVPRLVRFMNDPETRGAVLRHISEQVGFPVIIRDPFTQKGVGADKIDTPAQLDAHLASLPGKQLYAIQYIHNPVSDGIYRKIRAAVIGNGIYLTHVHFASRWNVHRERDKAAAAAFNLDRKFTTHANSMMTKPEETLGRPAMAGLLEIRRRTPLDLFGIDFDILPDGQVLFFEANAAMNLALRGHEGREEVRSAMRAAVRHLLQNPPARNLSGGTREAARKKTP